MVDLPVHKILGGARDKVKAYASTYPNIGKPEDYAEHALECKKQGYKAYKVHAYICWNPHTWEPAPQVPGFPKEDVEVCKAVREAVGDDMYDVELWRLYFEQSLGRRVEKTIYWLEHPGRTRKSIPTLTRELDSPFSPEHRRLHAREWVSRVHLNAALPHFGHHGILQW